MSNYIRVVFVKFGQNARKAYMFESSRDNYFNEGDTVIIDRDGDGVFTEATVVDEEDYDLESRFDKEKLNRLLMVAGTNMPLKKIRGKVKREFYEYDDDIKKENTEKENKNE